MDKHKITELASLIERHNKAYWDDSDPLISDAEYDRLVEELKAVAPDHPLLHSIESSGSTRQKVAHDIPMLSLGKCYSPDELTRWAESVSRGDDERFILSSKKDGISAESWAGMLVTRGNGSVGFDISDRIPYVKGLSRGRGEICVTKADFIHKRPARGKGELFKTELSAAAGMINDTNPVPRGVLTFVPFHVDGVDLTLQELRGLDWEIVVQEFLNGPYPLDGLVLSLFDLEYSRSLGVTSHHPRGSMALKFKNPSAETKVIDIRWTSGKGRLTPTAILEPVEISGFMNSKASLHNLDNMVAMGIGLGSVVEVERCGGIIPQIKRVTTPGEDPKESIPTGCPDCGEQVKYVSPNLICPNKECCGSKAKLLLDSLRRLGIENVGAKTASVLVDHGYQSVDSLVNAACSKDFEKLPGFAEVAAAGLAAEMSKLFSGDIWDYQVLAASGIPGVGLSTAKKILGQVTLEELTAMSEAELSRLPDVGPLRAEAIHSGFPEVDRLDFLINPKPSQVTGSATKPTVVFTGKNSQPRKFWGQHAENLGYEPVKSVTKDLDLLVCEDVESTSSKTKKARKYGIEIKTYEEFADAGE